MHECTESAFPVLKAWGEYAGFGEWQSNLLLLVEIWDLMKNWLKKLICRSVTYVTRNNSPKYCFTNASVNQILLKCQILDSTIYN